MFQKLFRRKEVIGLDNLKQVTLYLHRNPIHHGYAVDIHDDAWTSYRSVLSAQQTSLERKKVLEWFDGQSSFQQVHEDYIDGWRNTREWLLEET